MSTGIYSSGVITPFPAGFTGAALNAQGDVAGTTATGNLAILRAGVVTDLGVGGTAAGVDVSAINASDQIVGSWLDPVYVGFIYDGGVMTNIMPMLVPPRDQGSGAEDINDTGEVTGCNDLSGGGQEGWILASGLITDLGPGCGLSINAGGQVAGYVEDSSGFSVHAAIYDQGSLTKLTEPPPYNSSEAWAINSTGQVVGSMSYGTGSSTVSGVFFYNGGMTSLDSLISPSDPLKSTVKVIAAFAINDQRLILIEGQDPLGNAHGYLLQAPWLDITPGPLAFPAQQLGTHSPPQVLTLTNSGTTPLPIDSISSTAEFPQTNTCPGLLAAGAKCTVSLTFSPVTTAGDRASLLDVVTDGATITVPLSGPVAITITLSANPNQPSSGAPFTITWTAPPGSTCNSSGGATGDGWAQTGTPMNPPPPLPASGSASVKEATPGAYAYMMSCTAGSQSATTSLSVNIVAPVDVVAPASGGGGAIDLWSLLALSGALGFGWLRATSCATRPRF